MEQQTKLKQIIAELKKKKEISNARCMSVLSLCSKEACSSPGNSTTGLLDVKPNIIPLEIDSQSLGQCMPKSANEETSVFEIAKPPMAARRKLVKPRKIGECVEDDVILKYNSPLIKRARTSKRKSPDSGSPRCPSKLRQVEPSKNCGISEFHGAKIPFVQREGMKYFVRNHLRQVFHSYRSVTSAHFGVACNSMCKSVTCEPEEKAAIWLLCNKLGVELFNYSRLISEKDAEKVFRWMTQPPGEIKKISKDGTKKKQSKCNKRTSPRGVKVGKNTQNSLKYIIIGGNKIKPMGEESCVMKALGVVSTPLSNSSTCTSEQSAAECQREFVTPDEKAKSEEFKLRCEPSDLRSIVSNQVDALYSTNPSELNIARSEELTASVVEKLSVDEDCALDSGYFDEWKHSSGSNEEFKPLPRMTSSPVRPIRSAGILDPNNAKSPRPLLPTPAKSSDRVAVIRPAAATSPGNMMNWDLTFPDARSNEVSTPEPSSILSSNTHASVECTNDPPVKTMSLVHPFTAEPENMNSDSNSLDHNKAHMTTELQGHSKISNHLSATEVNEACDDMHNPKNKGHTVHWRGGDGNTLRDKSRGLFSYLNVECVFPDYDAKQSGVVHVHLCADSSSKCICCSTCAKFFSWPEFCQHFHGSRPAGELELKKGHICLKETSHLPDTVYLLHHPETLYLWNLVLSRVKKRTHLQSKVPVSTVKPRALESANGQSHPMDLSRKGTPGTSRVSSYGRLFKPKYNSDFVANLDELNLPDDPPEVDSDTSKDFTPEDEQENFKTDCDSQEQDVFPMISTSDEKADYRSPCEKKIKLPLKLEWKAASKSASRELLAAVQGSDLAKTADIKSETSKDNKVKPKQQSTDGLSPSVGGHTQWGKWTVNAQLMMVRQKRLMADNISLKKQLDSQKAANKLLIAQVEGLKARYSRDLIAGRDVINVLTRQLHSLKKSQPEKTEDSEKAG